MSQAGKKKKKACCFVHDLKYGKYVILVLLMVFWGENLRNSTLQAAQAAMPMGKLIHHYPL